MIIGLWCSTELVKILSPVSEINSPKKNIVLDLDLL